MSDWMKVQILCSTAEHEWEKDDDHRAYQPGVIARDQVQAAYESVEEGTIVEMVNGDSYRIKEEVQHFITRLSCQ